MATIEVQPRQAQHFVRAMSVFGFGLYKFDAKTKMWLCKFLRTETGTPPVAFPQFSEDIVAEREATRTLYDVLRCLASIQASAPNKRKKCP